MATKQKSVKMNMVMNALLTISSLIFPLITFPYASRILLPEGTGKVGFATSVVSYFAMFVSLGIPMYGVKACAKVRDDREKLSRLVHELLMISFTMIVVVYSVFLVAVNVVPRIKEEKTLFFVISATIILNALGCEWLYKALEEYTYITVRSIVFKFIALVALFVLVHEKSDYVLYGGITIFAASASNVLNFINMRKHISFKWLGGYNLRQHFKMIMVFFSMSIATTIYTNLDNVMLGFMKGDVEVGYYTAAVKIKNILMGIVTSASTVLLPRASYYVDKNMMDEFYRILKKTMHFIILMAFSFSAYFIIFAREGVLFLSGDAFEGAILPMMVIMPTLLLIGITNVTGIQMMVPLGMEKQVLLSEIIGAVVDLVLNMIFIPMYGALGAAIGTLVAEIFVMLYQLYAIRRVDTHVFGDVPWLKVILATALAATACIWVKLAGLGVFLSLAASAVCFFGVYGGVLLLAKDGLVTEIFGQVMRKLRR